MTRALLTLLFTATFVLSPLATEPFSGYRADQLPIPQVDPPAQPAGYAFAIWGLIYGWLVVSALFGAWKRAEDPAWDVARPALIAALALGTPWLWVANRSAEWATVLIFAMAAAAILALMRAPGPDRGWLRAPVAIFAGWLTAASFVSLAATAAGHGLIAGATGWAYLAIAGAGLVAALVQLRRPDSPEYGATVIWALAGIIAANGTALWPVTAVAALAALILAAIALRPRPA
ncbi:MAG: CAAX amino terminal protease family [Rhodobacteraceae bacterium HLUCCA08]|nr:MAG: CAAX amino terminal protease family [Rhodobacteraceae bacterium HLUCCA08]